MSENVEIVRRRLEVWNEGDPAVIAERARESEWDFTNYEGWPEKPIIRGEELVGFLAEWRETFGDYFYGVDRLVDVDDDRVLALCWQEGRGPGSTRPVRMEWAQIFTVRDGGIARVENYSDRERALEAAGLAE